MIHFHSLRVKKVEKETDDCVSICFDVPEEFKDLRKNLLWKHKIFTGEAKPNVIRLLPSLALGKAEVNQFLEAVKEEVQAPVKA